MAHNLLYHRGEVDHTGLMMVVLCYLMQAYQHFLVVGRSSDSHVELEEVHLEVGLASEVVVQVPSVDLEDVEETDQVEEVDLAEVVVDQVEDHKQEGVDLEGEGLKEADHMADQEIVLGEEGVHPYLEVQSMEEEGVVLVEEGQVALEGQVDT